ncbi:MAG TPA: choice-of-anchor J domain-containing protein [Ignavibacteria bacterium]|nr:choice-of-anchor J domain-containing protein [Ignavibacteria bacterium]
MREKNYFLPVLLIIITGFYLGFNVSDPFGSRNPQNVTDSPNPSVINPELDNAGLVVFVDSLNGANDTTALKNRGYKVYYRGGGPQGLTATWFQPSGTPPFPSFNGPTTGYVAANFNAVTGINNIDSWLVLPRLTGGTQAGDSLYFYSRAPSASTFPDSIRVMYSANDSVPEGTWTELGRFKVNTANAWERRGFRAPSASANGRFAIRYAVANGGPSGSNSDFIGIDMITIESAGAPPISGDSTLVIINDSTGTTVQRTNDRDTLRKYLPMLVGKYRIMTKDTSTVLPNLSNYSTVILQETAFDAVFVRGLSAAQRNVIKTWLATGTPTNKKSLILIGGDMGYNYDRTGSTYLDTTFSRTYGGFQYKVDNGGAINFNAVINIGGGSSDSLLTAPPGASYWPDGCAPISGGNAWNRYRQRGTTDTLAGITKVGPTSVVVTMFQDPRYYASSGGVGGTDFGFKRVLKGAIDFVRTNNGTITGVTPLNNSIAERYILSQNYPNPFNPTTKINFSLPKSGNTTLKIYDMLGKEVMTLVNDFKVAGNYVVDFNAATLSSGTYFYRLESNGFVDTKKMLLIK